MIVHMKKAVVIVQSKDADSAVRKLRSLGVMHIEHQGVREGKDVKALGEDIELINEAARILSVLKSSPENSDGRFGEEIRTEDWKFIARHILEWNKRIDQLNEYSKTLERTVSEWEEWGDFNPQEIISLARKNIHVGLYRIPAREIERLPAGVIVEKLFSSRGFIGCAVISEKKLELPFKELALPKAGLDEVRVRLAENRRVIETIEYALKKHICCLEEFTRTKTALQKELELNEAIRGMGEAKNIVYLKGYIPHDAVELLLTSAGKEKWGIVIDDVSEDDNVPTLLRNSRWVSLIEPVFRLLEVVPGYREMDISPVFLCFLSLFFGMIIGDAGYGFIYLILSLWLRKKLAGKISDSRIFSLLCLFSSCTIFWGLLTGTVFGQEWYIKAGLKPLLPILNNTKFLQAFCFFLGAFHLTLAHLWQALRKAPSLAALSDAGWISLLWAGFFLAKTLILDNPFPVFGKHMIIIGLLLVIFCSNPQKNILKTVASGLGTVALSLMNNFTDVVSYIRLFAVGLAGVAISDTVNALASGFTGKMIPVQMLIIFAGHTINIVLGPMSVLVHGIRLNVLEFSGHAGLSWSGVAYKPLKE